MHMAKNRSKITGTDSLGLHMLIVRAEGYLCAYEKCISYAGRHAGYRQTAGERGVPGEQGSDIGRQGYHFFYRRTRKYI